MKPSSPLSETTISNGNYFQFEFDKDYQRLQIQFLDHVDQHDLQGIMVCLELTKDFKLIFVFFF